MKLVHIRPQPLTKDENSVTVSAFIDVDNESQQLLWYSVPVEYEQQLTPNADPFVIGAIFLLMEQGYDVKVHGEVSPSLLANLDDFQDIWSSWRPEKYKRVRIYAEAEKELPPCDSNLGITAFSGGVDSCFTAYHHKSNVQNRRKHNITAGMMVHGFDIPIQDPVFDSALVGSRKILHSLQMDCIPVSTNFRDIITIDWEDVFGSAVASCLHLFKSGYAHGYMPSSRAYNTRNLVYGSNPLTDKLLSSQTFDVVHDGAVFTRMQKMDILNSWKEAKDNLRVCWQGKVKDRNCGRCEKCIRNILNYRILNLPLPACFEQDISLVELMMFRIHPNAFNMWRMLYNNARAHNINAPWVYALRFAIIKNKITVRLKSLLPQGVRQLAKSMITLVGFLVGLHY